MVAEEHAFKHTLISHENNKTKNLHKCLYFAITRWLCNESISNVVYRSFNFVTAFFHFKKPEIIKAFTIHAFK